MKLYLLTRKNVPESIWDKMLGYVIAANDEKEAFELSNSTVYDWVETIDEVDILELGEANTNIEKGIILEDYCSG